MKSYVFVGGTGGIGLAAAKVLAPGAAILVVGRDRTRGERAERLLREAGAIEALWQPAELRSMAGVQAAAAAIGAWKPRIDGLVHSAMVLDLRQPRQHTLDGYDLAYGLQYLARARLNLALRDVLAASGDGRIVHIAAQPPRGLIPNLDDLQFERRRWSLMASLMSSQVLGFLHAQEATRRWRELPVSISLACVGPTQTEAIRSQPWWARALYAVIATSPERSAANVVRLLTAEQPYKGVATLSARRFSPMLIDYDPALAERVWEQTLANA